jgi:hypothetical protein
MEVKNMQFDQFRGRSLTVCPKCNDTVGGVHHFNVALHVLHGIGLGEECFGQPSLCEECQLCFT